jgi:uncharacterized protein YqjF (DUF2071 family)
MRAILRAMTANMLSAAARQSAALGETNHRPWPLPAGGWSLGQTWESLLFAHWRVPVSAVRALVPPALDVDIYEEDAWLGITPFLLRGLRVRGTLPLPVASTFPELNVRTYVSVDGKPGIFFLSLDAANGLAVAGARRLYKLPYFRARMSMRQRGTRVQFESVRSEPGAHRRAFEAGYRPVGPTFEARPGTLEYFLTERYCLYTVEGRRLYRAEIHHPPWQLAPADAFIEENTMVPAPLELPAAEPLLHYAPRQDTLVWPLQRAVGESRDPPR